jgi:hypothetical protein
MRLKIEFSRQWTFVPHILNTVCGEFKKKKGINWLCFNIFVFCPLEHVNLREPVRKALTTDGMILVTESDEQDKLYITNRSTGFEISYHDFEIFLKDGVLSVYHFKDNLEIEDKFEDTETLNLNINI